MVKGFNPLLSVIIPVYNVDKFLHDSLESVIHQSFNDFEMIVINDGSTDNSAAILEEIVEGESRMNVIKQKNRGLASTRNRGLDESRGKYIYFFDSDDLLDIDAFKKIIEFAEQTDSDVVNFSSLSIDEKGKETDIVKQMQYSIGEPIPGEELFIQLYNTGNYAANTQKYLYRKSHLKSKKIRFDDGFIHEDESFTLEALCLAERAVALPDRLLKKRFRTDSIMSGERTLKNAEGWAKASLRLIEFKTKHPLKSKSMQYIDQRIVRLSKNAIKLQSSLAVNNKQVPNVYTLLPPKELKRGGVKLALSVHLYVFYISVTKCLKRLFLKQS